MNPIYKLFQFKEYIAQKYYEGHYDFSGVLKEEKIKFSEYGFDYDRAYADLNDILKKLGPEAGAVENSMASVHWLLFCAISQVVSPKKILEIGTYDGFTAKILAHIFNAAEIVTIDLPEDDPIYKKSYNRQDPSFLKSFQEKQRRNLDDSSIRFVQGNSLFLNDLIPGETFDLIWVDGGDFYPEIAWDIANAYHLCNDRGWIMCDDVFPYHSGYRDAWVAPDSFDMLNSRERTGDSITFYKRLAAEWSAVPKKRKYVALMQKKGSDGMGQQDF